MNKKNGEKDKPTHIVGVGASAGGLEAIESLFSAMPVKSGMAFVVVQHLSPDYKSLMVEILSKKTSMKVLRAKNGMTVQSNHIYLITPKKNLTIFHGKLLLHEQDMHKGINLPIDLFLKSLAEDQAEKAIGIILSGTGSDGMRGVRAIKEYGGFVLVQDEESARFDGMPRSAISTGLADFIIPPEEMPQHLSSFAKHPSGLREDYTDKLLTDEENLTRIFSLLRDKHKIDFTYYKMTTVIRRIKRRMTVNNITHLSEYVRFMEDYPREATSLYKELLIGVTNFFRDKEAYKILKEDILPELLKRKAGQQIRFWVAGCSTGEEAYTMAMLCRECISEFKLNVDVKIFATDVDEDAILKAGNGLYPESVAADLSSYYLTKYFFRKGDSYQIVRSIREMVVFAQHNIIKDPPFTNIELISCRNLLIYLQPILQHKILDFFNFSLNPKAVLFLGSSESIGDMMDYFDPVNHKWKIYRSRGRKKQPGILQDVEIKNKRKRFKTAYSTRPHMNQYTLDHSLERLLQALHKEYIPLSIIVNDQHEIVHVVGDINKYFKVPVGSFSTKITRMAHKELSIPISTGLQKVFKLKEDVNYTNIILRLDDHKAVIDMQIRLLPEKRGQEPLVVILINEVEHKKDKTGEASSQRYDLAEEAEQRLYDLEQELQFTRENLQATIEELETSNEELQATNEELLASNEELQSTNEELQSVNEELHTVNSEYQAKIQELSELNNDMDNLMSSNRIGTLFLDENLEIRRFTPQVREILNISEKDIERPITNLNHNIKDVKLLPFIKQVQKKAEIYEGPVETIDGRFFLMRILPYQIGPKTFSGVVLTFIDISKIHALQEALNTSEQRLRTAANIAKIGYWEIDLNTMQTSWTDEVYRIHELEPGSYHDVQKGIEFYHQEDRPKIEKAVEKCIKTGKEFDLELRFITAKKKLKWVRAIGKVKRIQAKIVSVFGTFQDISDYVEAKSALQESQFKYKELFDTIKSGVIIYDTENEGKNFVVKDVNNAAEEICRIDRDEIIGKSVEIVFPAVKNMGLLKVFQDVWKTGHPGKLSTSFYEDDRISLWVENRVHKLPSGDVVAVFEDVSEIVNQNGKKKK